VSTVKGTRRLRRGGPQVRRCSVVIALAISFLFVGASPGIAAPFTATPNSGLAPGGQFSGGVGTLHLTGTPLVTVTGTSSTWVATCFGAAPTSGSECLWETAHDVPDNVQIGGVAMTGASGQFKLWPFDCTKGIDIGFGLFIHPGEAVWIGWIDQSTIGNPDTKPLLQTQQLQYDCGGGPPPPPPPPPPPGGDSLVFPVHGGNATLVTSAGTIIGAFTTDPLTCGCTLSYQPPAGYAYPYGLISFTITGLTPGATITVTVTLPGPVTAWIKFALGGINTGYSVFPGATFSGNQVVLTLTDGGAGDTDGAADGSITDPALPAVRHGQRDDPRDNEHTNAPVAQPVVITPAFTG
jgi:hypothetical protein